ncbi:MAG: TonB-dependent receptor [Chlorobi bacterium]|nr:TonB-dependent receptor [Chlorobiota bacterium]
MRKPFFNLKKTFVFKQWKNTGWSIFAAVGKHIVISVLPLSYFLLSVFNSEAQTDTVRMDEVEIVSSRVPSVYSESARIIYVMDKAEIETLPVHDFIDLIEYAANIDVRKRGDDGVQSDINIRGGNFNQTLILLNGFKMNDVQTGHHNTDLPVSAEDIVKIEILEGPGNRVFGINAYSGAINFITDDKTSERLRAGGFYGSNNYFKVFSNASYGKDKLSGKISVSYKQSDGYLENEDINNTDFNIFNIFWQNKIKTRFADFSFQAGYKNKAFGANSFYTPRFPWQYERTKTSFAAFKIEKRNKNRKLTNSFFYRRHQDRFELFREDRYKHTGEFYICGTDTAKYVEGIYEDWNYYQGHNYHLTEVAGSELKFNINSGAGSSAAGIEYTFSRIKSNVLGEPLDVPETVPGEPDGLFTKSASQHNVNLYAEHLIKIQKTIFSAGASLNIDSRFKTHFSGGADLSYSLSKKIKLFLSLNQSARLPTFTDLYYDGPINKGNPELMPETALTFETGTKFFYGSWRANISAFYRKGKDVIDWVRLSDTTDWQADNITELDALGAEISFKYNFPKSFYFKNAGFSYSYNNVTKKSGDYISKYALDYLKHKFVFSFTHKVNKEIYAAWKIRYEDRAGTYSVYDSETEAYTGEERYDPYCLTDLRLFWKKKRFEIYLDAFNLFNVEYAEFGNVLSPGRRIQGGIKLKFNY